MGRGVAREGDLRGNDGRGIPVVAPQMVVRIVYPMLTVSSEAASPPVRVNVKLPDCPSTIEF